MSAHHRPVVIWDRTRLTVWVRLAQFLQVLSMTEGIETLVCYLISL